MNADIEQKPKASALSLVACPVCRKHFESAEASLRCANCNKTYAYEEGIPLLFSANEWDNSKEDVTERIKAFYEETPFPNYDGVDNPEMLRAKAVKGIFARLLDEQISHGSKILEVGCGTGQL